MISEPVLICLFRNGLRSPIRTQAEQKGCWKDTWNQTIKNTITHKAKAALNLSLWVCKINTYYFQGHRSISKPTKNHMGTKASFRSATRKHEPCFFIASSPPRPRDFSRTTRKIGSIKILAIAGLTGPGLRTLPRPPGLMQPRPRLETIVIVAATGQCNEKIRTWARPYIITVTSKAILPTNAPSPTNQ